MSAHVLSHGSMFAGKYRVERCIGSGGMGAVYQAEHADTERRVALKVMLPQSLITDSHREQFKQEARVVGRIRHPNIVDVLDAGVDDATKMPYLVMELLEGEDLGSRVARRGPLLPDEAVGFLHQIASALDCLHERSIVHRDLKPENLFLTSPEEGPPAVKLLDFGVAKVIAEGSSAAFTQDAHGTPVYMAPEQFAEQIRISPATDIYALGMLAFTLLTGQHYWGSEVARGMNVFMLARIAEAGPKEAARVRARRAGTLLPPEFDEWFATVTALQPNERYPTAGVAIEALAEALNVALPAERSRKSRSPGAPRATRPPTPPPTPRAVAEVRTSSPPLPLRREQPSRSRSSLMKALVIGLSVTIVALVFLRVLPALQGALLDPASGAVGPGATSVASAGAGIATPGDAPSAAMPPASALASQLEPSAAAPPATAASSAALPPQSTSSARRALPAGPQAAPSPGAQGPPVPAGTPAKRSLYTRE